MNMNSMPSLPPLKQPDDVADVVGVASAQRAAWERLSKPELVELAMKYADELTAKLQKLKRLERRVAKRSKGK